VSASECVRVSACEYVFMLVCVTVCVIVCVNLCEGEGVCVFYFVCWCV